MWDLFRHNLKHKVLGVMFQIVHTCDRKCKLIVVSQTLAIGIFAVDIVTWKDIIDIVSPVWLRDRCVPVLIVLLLGLVFRGRVWSIIMEGQIQKDNHHPCTL